MRTITNSKIEKAIELLDAYGVSFTSTSIKSESENAYSIVHGTDGIRKIELSNDVDLNGVFEEEKIEGMVFTEFVKDSGFKTAQYPTIVLTF